MTVEKMSMGTRIKLSLMMFLQFMLFAAFFPQLAAYAGEIGCDGLQMALIVSSMAIGCLVSPIVGMVADRHFNSEKVLFTVNALGGVLLFLASKQTDPTVLFFILLLYMFCYMPTWGLTSSIAMSNSPSKLFPQIRAFGSFGWFASGIFSFVAMKAFDTKIDGTSIPLLCGAGTSILAAVVALFLPKTPPPAKGQPASVVDALGLRSMTLLKDKNFAMFILVSVLAMIPFSIYWSYCSVFLQDKGFAYITITMNWGQAAEFFILMATPLLLAKAGVRWAMVLGLVALLVRYIAFLCGGLFDMRLLYFIAILVHGAIYGLFFVGGQIYINQKAPKEMQAQAQGFIFLATFGIGLLVGNFVNGALINRYMTEATVDGVLTKVFDWNHIWGITAVISAVLLVAFVALFKDDTVSSNEADETDEAVA
ncbi:MAG: MFS transporter [Kiritimatiellia bacterium]|jgi:nucleoside transporter|nr:MFS transporter [Kiritimatiellia bacterium]